MNDFLAKLDRLYKPFVVLSVFVLVVLAIANIRQRAAAVKEIRDFTVVNRQMLNARAQIQIILIDATIADRKLTAEEIDRIGRLWNHAQYDQTESVEVNEK